MKNTQSAIRIPEMRPFTNSQRAVIIVIASMIFLNLKLDRPSNNLVIHSDVTSYYGYLPAAFIHGDLTLSFTDGKEIEYANEQQFWPERTEDGRKVIKMTSGLAYLYAPFFFIAHTQALLTSAEADGFSEPYHRWIHWSVLFYLFFGLLCLRSVLCRFFSEETTALTLIFVVLGTNITFYTFNEAAMSHTYSFSLSAVLIWLYFKWLDNPGIRTSLAAGLIAGPVILIRPVNIVILIFFLVHLAGIAKKQKGLSAFLIERSGSLTVIVLSAFAIGFTQMIYWKIAAGEFIFFSYTQERFFFDRPKILEGLLSYRKGWLVYTPVMIFSLLGLIPLYRYLRAMFWGIVLFFAVFVYVIFSWWCWWYGGSFGMRAMIDAHAVMAFPFAAFIANIMEQKREFIRLPLFAIMVFCTTLNLFQSFQYIHGMIHWDGMTKETYWESFFNLELPEEYYEKMEPTDAEKAMKGEREYEFDPF